MLDAPEKEHVLGSGSNIPGQRRVVPPRSTYVTAGSGAPLDAFEDGLHDDGEFGARRRRPGLRLHLSSGLWPGTLWGRIIIATGGLVLVGAATASLLLVRGYMWRDEHFLLAGPASIQIDGNAHLTRPQVLSVFGGDVERSIFAVPISQRRAELESLPWVAHATVMRLLPNQVRIHITERTPVAFVREGSKIGLADTHGVLLDIAAPEQAEEGAPPARTQSYSFPVLTGISAADPLSTRAARMKIYVAFLAALDASGEHVSQKLSEVDLSNPEDVKAILPDQGVDLLVHFGSERYLERYRKFEQHLAEWKTQYPKLASVDMRYERQVVLEMAAGTASPVGTSVATNETSPTLAVPQTKPSAKQPSPAPRVAVAHAGAITAKPAAVTAPKPAASAVTPTPAATSPVAASPTTAPPHLTTAFPVTSSRPAKPGQGAASAAYHDGGPQ